MHPPEEPRSVVLPRPCTSRCSTSREISRRYSFRSVHAMQSWGSGNLGRCHSQHSNRRLSTRPEFDSRWLHSTKHTNLFSNVSVDLTVFVDSCHGPWLQIDSSNAFYGHNIRNSDPMTNMDIGRSVLVTSNRTRSLRYKCHATTPIGTPR